MASGMRILFRLTVILRPALLIVLIALYLSPLATHGVRTSVERSAETSAARQRLQAARGRVGRAAHATPVYFQAAVLTPLKWLGSDLCYIEMTSAQIRVMESMAAR